MRAVYLLYILLRSVGELGGLCGSKGGNRARK